MTLVELVLAFSLFSFLMASVGHLVLMSLRVQRSWGQVVAPAQSAERALQRLAQDLQAAQPLLDVPFQVVSGGDGLEFARLGEAAWRRVVYRLEPDGDTQCLVREEWAWETGELLGHETLAGLGAGQFSVGRLTEDGLLVWMPSWDPAADGIPRLVKFDGEGQSRVFRNPAGALPQEEE